LEKSNSKGSKLDSNGWKSQTVTVGNLTVTVDFHVNTINKRIESYEHLYIEILTPKIYMIYECMLLWGNEHA